MFRCAETAHKQPAKSWRPMRLERLKTGTYARYWILSVLGCESILKMWGVINLIEAE